MAIRVEGHVVRVILPCETEYRKRCTRSVRGSKNGEGGRFVRSGGWLAFAHLYGWISPFPFHLLRSYNERVGYMGLLSSTKSYRRPSRPSFSRMIKRVPE
jgi:hypothetical protein